MVSLINSYLAIFLFSVSSEEVHVYNKSEQFDEKTTTNKQTNKPNEKTNKHQPKTIIQSPILPFTCLLFVNLILNNDDRNSVFLQEIFFYAARSTFLVFIY